MLKKILLFTLVFITTNGIITMSAVTSVPVLSKKIDVVLNEIRINLEGVNVAQKGESYTLNNGAEVPYSILYEGTTYLPLRQIAEMTGKQIHWNGDTKTVVLTDPIIVSSKSNPFVFGMTLAEHKSDLNGNTWTYSYNIDNKGVKYLWVRDFNRDFSRIYNCSSGQVIRIENEESSGWTKNEDLLVFDDGIIFSDIGSGQIKKIFFESNFDTQDGIIISDGEEFFLFGDLMIAYGVDSNSNPIAEAINLKTSKKAEIGAGDIKESLDVLFMRISSQPIHRAAEYKGGYFYFESYTPYPDNRRLYRVKIEFGDTPIVGEIEDLGPI